MFGSFKIFTDLLLLVPYSCTGFFNLIILVQMAAVVELRTENRFIIFVLSECAASEVFNYWNYFLSITA